MKSKISITIEEELLSQLDRLLKDGLFRNKSHIIEYSVKKFIREKNGRD
jgi:metal-responsive CopG/Arc/MetJ family transcriptional regulator